MLTRPKVLCGMRRFVRRGVDRVLRGWGYERPPVKVLVDLSELAMGPLEAVRRANGRRVIVSVPMDTLRTLAPLGFPLGRNATHPYVETARQWLTGSHTTYFGSALCAYYDAIQPRNGAELLGSGALFRGSRLERMTPIETAYPWHRAPGPSVEQYRRRWIHGDSKEHGVERGRTLAWPIVGPISHEDGEHNFSRIVHLVESVKDTGFDPNGRGTGHVTGTVLHDGSRLVVAVGGGQHRVAVLDALGYAAVPVLLHPRRLVSRTSVSEWPGVRSGAFSVEQALAVFDRLLGGGLPECVPEAWYGARPPT